MMQTILCVFAIFITFIAAQDNYPCDALFYGGIIGPQTVTGVITTSAVPEGFPGCGTTNEGAGAIWFYIPGRIQDLTVSTCPNEGGQADYDTKLNIFTPDECGCLNCGDPASFICVDGNDDQCSVAGSVLRSRISATGEFCNLMVVLHGFGGAEGTADVNFNFTPIDQTSASGCPDCGKSFRASKGECEQCLSWNSYVNTLCGSNLHLQPVDFEDLLEREDNCLDGFTCLLDDAPGSVVTFDSGFPDSTIIKGICVPDDGVSINEPECVNNDDCPSCMRCCADQDGNKQCRRNSGDICGFAFEDRGPCCCPEDTCCMDQCITQSPTKSPTPPPTTAPTTPAPTDSSVSDDDDDEEQQFFDAKQMLGSNDGKSNVNENVNMEYIADIDYKILITLWSMGAIGIISIIILGYVCLCRKKGQASFNTDMDQLQNV